MTTSFVRVAVTLCGLVVSYTWCSRIGTDSNVSAKNTRRSTNTYKINVCSWNVGQSNPSGNLDSWLGLNVQDQPDIVSIGLQEIDDDTKWKEYLLALFSKNNYVMVKQRKMKWIVQYLFLKRQHLTQTNNIESETTATGVLNLVGNKGGVSIRLDFYGSNMIFVNSHLAAHLENVQDRIDDYNRIMNDQSFRDGDVNTIIDHSYIFWMGDLNFRIDDLTKADIEAKIVANDLKAIQKHDQLLKARANGRIFQGFSEAPIKFAPTYKFDPGTDVYDTSSKQRKPAWTDRILWKTVSGARLNSYTSYPQYRISDHKPISARFSVQVSPSGPALPITFSRVADISRGKSLAFTYSCASNMDTSSWDWIALFKENFSSFDDYEAWTRADGCDKAMEFDQDDTALKGNYRLGYFSKSKNCIIGYSNIFSVM
ncbi:phosphatidylinositol 4,5-bisphosphate 5-phosphatase A-like [Tubulanus polymorphus]|uniref:phosphatidylinositol 4,5-bisphosphate 5-phosphatase A-like n=1 Tax=Tubulanus polymorphus TaxID=672921 RepID=UPI003DA2AD95